MNTIHPKQHKGFTLVELLIVIVIIGILAAISIVAYNGITEKARFATMRSDLSSLNKAIQLYYADNGYYPITLKGAGGGALCSTGSWCGFNQGVNDNFIPGLTPDYISQTPQLPDSNKNDDTYIYRSPDGTDYKLVRYINTNIGGLPDSEKEAFSDLRAVCNGTAQTDRWGYWSSDTSKCW